MRSHAREDGNDDALGEVELDGYVVARRVARQLALASTSCRACDRDADEQAPTHHVALGVGHIATRPSNVRRR
jgi:hypothetical protein